jgi:hypothetical protein
VPLDGIIERAHGNVAFYRRRGDIGSGRQKAEEREANPSEHENQQGDNNS